MGEAYAIVPALSLTVRVISTPPATLHSHSCEFSAVRKATAGLGLLSRQFQGYNTCLQQQRRIVN